MRFPVTLPALALLAAFSVPAGATTHSAADLVKDGPAAETTRTSLRLLEEGDASEDETVKLDRYTRGRALAEQAVRRDPKSADAHFALFANWGRYLQVDGWLKNSFQLPALQRELDRALALDPDHADGLASKGGLYLQLPGFLGGDAAKAEPLLRRSIELDELAVGARLELADYYVQKGEREKARELASAALRLAGEQGKARFERRAKKLLKDLRAPGRLEAGLAR